MKEIEGRLLATNKELDEYKALAKNNDKRFKYYQNKALELEVTLRKKDCELNKCKETVNKNEEMVEQNQIRINDCESKLASQVVQIEILRNKVEVIEEELKLYDWRIDWIELENNGILESTPFNTTPDLYCLSLSVCYDQSDFLLRDEINIYLHRCRDYDKEDEMEGRIQNLGGFYYKIYIVCGNRIVFSNSGSFTNCSLFNIGRAHERSRGFLCFRLDFGNADFLLGRNFHIFVTTNTI